MNLFVIRVLWGALLAATLLYLVVPALAKRPDEMSSPVMLFALAGVALVTAMLSVVLPRHMWRGGLERKRFKLTSAAVDTDDRLFREAPPTERRFADPEQVRRSLLPLYFTPFILGMALAEAVAIYGLVLLFLGAGYGTAIGFYLVAWALMIVRFPTEARIVGAVERIYGAKLDASSDS